MNDDTTQDNMTTLMERISEVYPNLGVVQTEIVTAGQNNTVVIVNGDLVFRFPRYEVGIDNLVREVRVLRTLQGRTPIPIPVPIYAKLSPRVVGQVFVGYERLPGVPLSQIPAAALDEDEDIRPLALQLGAFLAALHDVPLASVGINDVPNATIYHRWDDISRRIASQLFPLMRPDARQQVCDHFERFLNDPRTLSLRPVLTHGDFGASNILYDPATHHVTGVIDFGSVDADDPAVDLAAASTIHPNLLDVIPDAYPAATDMLDRVAFYRGTFALQEALFGIESGDEDALRTGMEGYC